MAYRRFLNDRDYLALITEEGLNQLIRDVHDRIPQAERSAEVSVMEYLGQYYEVEREFERGKRILEYSEMISYPAGVFILKDNVIYRTLTVINGYTKPRTENYWELKSVGLSKEQMECTHTYSQVRTYHTGDIVRYGTEFWRCVNDNGYDFKNIRIPGYDAWKCVETTEWESAADYSLNDVVEYNGYYYALINKDDEYDPLVNPSESDYWGLIGEYTTDYEYSFEKDSYDYVEYDGFVFVPVRNPNADALEENVNIVPDDPRNGSLIKHMTQLALYQLHVLISPTNISQTRRLQYEDSMEWLYAASKFKIIIDIPRKKAKDNLPKTDFALATFHKDFDPWKDDWLI